jgi:hypothetical protein
VAGAVGRRHIGRPRIGRRRNSACAKSVDSTRVKRITPHNKNIDLMGVFETALLHVFQLHSTFFSQTVSAPRTEFEKKGWNCEVLFVELLHGGVCGAVPNTPYIYFGIDLTYILVSSLPFLVLLCTFTLISSILHRSISLVRRSIFFPIIVKFLSLFILLVYQENLYICICTRQKL